MNADIASETSTRSVLTISVPADEAAKTRAAVVKEYASQAALPGFRKGKAPAHLVEKRLHKPGAKERLLAFADAFAAAPEFTVESTEALVRAEADKTGPDGKPVGMGALVHPIRVAVSGRTEGPGLFEMLALLGRDRVVRRLRAAAAL